MTKRVAIFALGLLAGATLAGCGGGGGSAPTPFPTSSPTAAPRPLAVRITVTGRGQSSGVAAHATARSPLDVAQGEPVEESIKAPCSGGAANCNSIAANSFFGTATAKIEVVDANGVSVAAASPSVTIAAPNAALAPAPSSSSAPNATLINVNATTTQPAQTTLNAQYPNGGPSGTIGVRQFPFAGFEAPTVTDVDAAIAYTLQGPFLVPQSATAGADVYMGKDANGVMTLFAPGGLQVLGSAQPIGTLTTVLPFTSQGTSITLSSLTTSPVVVVKATQGYVIFKFGVVQCSYTSTPSACDISGMAGAIYNTAGTSGAVS